MFISYEVKQLKKTIIENPSDWDIGKYKITHNISGISLWIANGFICFNFEQGGQTLNIFEKFYLWGAIKKLTILKIISK